VSKEQTWTIGLIGGLTNRDHKRWRDVQNVEHALGKYIISDRPMISATIIDDFVEEFAAPGK
jgi:hypothetical protein